MSIRKNFAQLDGLRAIAAVSVFAHHIFQQYYEVNASDIPSLLFRHLGIWAVAVFFSLSGFCIHWARIRQTAQWGNFDRILYFEKRFLRIYPAFVVCLFLCFVAEHIRASNLLPSSPPQAVGMHLVLLSSFFPSFRVSVNNVVWSVVLEVQFYLIYGLIWKRFDRIQGVLSVTVIALASALAAFLASVILLPQGEWRVTLQHTVFATFWSWCLGALVAEVVKIQEKNSSQAPSTCIALLVWGTSLAICLAPGAIALQLDRFALPPLVATGLYLLVKSESRILVSAPFLSVGKSSYSLYLFHPLALWLFLEARLSTLQKVGLTIVAGLLLAKMCYRLFEFPFIKEREAKPRMTLAS